MLELADHLGCARAVWGRARLREQPGAARGIVPSVVGADGTLTAYRWGVARKRALLERERAFRQ